MRAAPRHLFLVGVLLLWPTFTWTARAQVAPCDASPKVRDALRGLPGSGGTGEADRARHAAALRLLLKRYPKDIFVHQYYQESAQYPAPARQRDPIVAEYRALAKTHPDDPVYAYLTARLQVGVNTKEAIPQLERIAPFVPPARLDLVAVYQAPNFKDPQKARAHLEAFMKTCPTALSAYAYLRSEDPSPLLAEKTARLRRILQSRTDPDSLTSYSTLWTLEFRVRPASEHDALRRVVADDLKRLRAIDAGKNAGYYSMLQNGYKLANDPERARWASEQARARSTRSAYYSVIDAWRKANPSPKPADPPETRKAFAKTYLQASDEWLRRLPDDTMLWVERVRAMREVDVTAPHIEEACEGLVNALNKNATPMGGTSFWLLAAQLYAEKGVRLDRLPDLVKHGADEIAEEEAQPRYDLYTSPERDEAERDYYRWYGATTIADIWIKAKDTQRGRETLLRVQALADHSKPTDDRKDPKYAAAQRTYLSRQVTYWRLMGDLAQLEDRKIDAITYYQNAMFARAAPPAANQRDELGEKMRALWEETGGSDEAWQAWSTRRDLFGQTVTDIASAGGGWAKIEKTLPEFELADLSGVKWRLADFKGKTTLVGIWATW